MDAKPDPPGIKLEFSSQTRVLFGRGELDRLGEIARPLGDRAFCLVGASSASRSGLAHRLQDALRSRFIATLFVSVGAEPTVGLVQSLLDQARDFGPHFLLAAGGGSVLDAGKALACLLANGGAPLDYLEIPGGGRPIQNPSLPLLAVPTTGGTGAEVTKNAVLRADDRSFKRSMRSPLMYPRVAIVDPALALSCPPAVTAASGMDALAQLIEAFTSRRAGVLTDGLAREGLRLVASALERAFVNGQDLDAREAMAMASLLSGMALDNAGLGAVHGLAAPLGALHDVPHGLLCANLLPEIVDANLELALSSDPHGRTAAKYLEVARILTGSDHAPLQRLVPLLRLLRKRLQIPPLGQAGVRQENLDAVLAACREGSMKTNPFYLDDRALRRILSALIRGDEPTPGRA